MACGLNQVQVQSTRRGRQLRALVYSAFIIVASSMCTRFSLLLKVSTPTRCPVPEHPGPVMAAGPPAARVARSWARSSMGARVPGMNWCASAGGGRDAARRRQRRSSAARLAAVGSDDVELPLGSAARRYAAVVRAGQCVTW